MQEYSILAGRAIADIFSRPSYWADIFTQMDSIGVGSLPIIILSGFFTGCVLALQSVTALTGVRRRQHDRLAGLALHGEGAWARC